MVCRLTLMSHSVRDMDIDPSKYALYYTHQRTSHFISLHEAFYVQSSVKMLRDAKKKMSSTVVTK